MVNTKIISMGAQLTRSSTRHLEEIKDLSEHGHSFLLVIEVHRVRQLLKLERHNRHKLQQNNAMIAALKNSPLLWVRLLLHKICGPPLSARSRVAEVGSLSARAKMATKTFVTSCLRTTFATLTHHETLSTIMHC